MEIQKIYNNYHLLYADLLKNNRIYRLAIKVPLLRLIFAAYKFGNIQKGSPESVYSYLNLVINTARKELKKIAPNAKFITILYNEKISNWHPNPMIKLDSDIMANTKIFGERDADGYNDAIVVQTRDITGFYFDKDYKLKKI